MISKLDFFDRKADLTVSNRKYALQVSELFEFLLKSDGYQDDITSNFLFNDKFSDKACGKIIAKQGGVMCGAEETKFFFEQKGLRLDFKKIDSNNLKTNDVICVVSGEVKRLLACERTLLNILQRMCGIASNVSFLQKKIESKTRLAATRKTLWGLLDKKAVACGGGLTHRLSLADGLLIKDNHLKLLSTSHKNAHETLIEKISTFKGVLPIEIEVETIDDLKYAIHLIENAKLTNQIIIMLDNFDIKMASEAISYCNKFNFVIELSGGINGKNLEDYGLLGVDVISLGALTHSSHALDMSLEFE